MNTQRPEWNDANNALVGYGISMVTLYYIRRYVPFLHGLINESNIEEFPVSEEVEQLFEAIYSEINGINELAKDGLTDATRKRVVDKLGAAGSEYREIIYRGGFTSKKKTLSANRIVKFLEVCLSVIDGTIKTNRREDGLYHSYNLIDLSEEEIKINGLYEMLEGQVAVLSSGCLSAIESIELLSSLRNSRLYREDQHSYMLYPNKELPLFIEKNVIPGDLVSDSRLLTSMLNDKNREIIYEDIDGNLHFQDDIVNSDVLKNKLRNLSDIEYMGYVEEELSTIIDIYEEIFDHNEFTGRATTFYKYEGLGSIYWHMVSKLLLAVQEAYFRAENQFAPQEHLAKLKSFYYDIKTGIGVEKSPEKYGAFPTDPYSHTPSFAGVQQPGMTGQVKEDILSRFRESGITVKSGKIVIYPGLLKKEEFLEKEEMFSFYDTEGSEQKILCKPGSFAITYCQVPFIYILSKTHKIVVHLKDGKEITLTRLEFSEELSRSIFHREGKTSRVEILLGEDMVMNQA
jgi:hypothetical protein